MDNRIAIVGMACRYPDAASAQDLWLNVLAQRRAFRLFPPERLDLESYRSDDPRAVDSTNARRGAFLENYQFDRLRYRITGDTYRSADMVHWLSLDVATAALADAGFPEAAGLPKDTTGVFIGNTLTGEFSRAGILRQRWPYVRKILSSLLDEEGWEQTDVAALTQKMELAYKRPFPVPGPDSLAGALSNTIAGRICNYYNLKGGGYAVDGACSSSLLSVIEGCSALLSGDLDVAVAGGVDLSLDPFELVGFSRAGAIASDTMRVFDARPTGFLPGEGCGFLVLRRYADAVAAGQRIYSVIRGWGISSDGAGGLIRPEVAGQAIALRRAYARAGFPIADVGYFEAHGTGTGVGDTVELQALIGEREAAGAASSATIGSIKAIIGHTKAASGIAGLIKASLAVWHAVLPPTTGCVDPHAELRMHASVLQASSEPMRWEGPALRRAGISSMAFGGLNTHLVIEETPDTLPAPLGVSLDILIASDYELFLISAATPADLLVEVQRQLSRVQELSMAELGDLAAALHGRVVQEVRCAIVAATPDELHARLLSLESRLLESRSLASSLRHLDAAQGIFLAAQGGTARIGLLFSGQASPVRRHAGTLGRYFAGSRAPYESALIPAGSDTDTAVAQPAIVAASLAGVAALEELGIRANLALGHSVGEIAALAWAGALSNASALMLAAERGRCLAATPRGSMVSISAPLENILALCADGRVEVAAINSAKQTVLSGNPHAIMQAAQKAGASGLHATVLPVSHAFHSRAMESAVAPFTAILGQHRQSPLQRAVYSTVTGRLLPREADLTTLLLRQLTQPVLFAEALEHAAAAIDLFIEVGPGAVLTGLAQNSIPVPAIALDAASRSHLGLLNVVAAAFALGIPVETGKLFRRRFTRPMAEMRHTFLANPCESVQPGASRAAGNGPIASGSFSAQADPSTIPAAFSSMGFDQSSVADQRSSAPAALDPVLTVRQLVARSGELLIEQIAPTDRMLDNLHLNSIVVAEIAARAAQELNRPPLRTPTLFSNASIEELAAALMEDNQSQTGAGGEIAGQDTAAQDIPGLGSWVRCFRTELLPAPLIHAPSTWSGSAAWTLHIANSHPLCEHFKATFAQPGEGVVFCVPPDDQGESAAAMLDVLHRLQPGERFLCIHHGNGGYAAFLRSIHAERSDFTIAVIRIPATPAFCGLAYTEGLEADGLTEAWYGEDGVRRAPFLRVEPVGHSTHLPLSNEDVLLVTGGARGIGAECALALARQSGARLLLLGRSELASNPEAGRNILRFSAAGIPFLYAACDIADQRSVARVIREMEGTFGKVTAVLHAAGHNAPVAFSALTSADLKATAAPKVDGLHNVLAALNPGSLRLCVSFGSIIGRTGMPGNADYALANERLRLSVEAQRGRYPDCRFLTLEWSLWSGVGMAERLGSVEALARRGMAAISPEQGTRMLTQILATAELSGPLVISAQFTGLSNLPLAGAEPPLLRFIEQVVRFIPGVELVAETLLHLDADPYLKDHRLGDSLLFPAVMGIEAMTEAAVALGLAPETLSFENLTFERPILASETHQTRIRLLALREAPDLVRVSLRSESTGFQLDHFSSTIRSGAGPRIAAARLSLAPSNLAAHTHEDIYGSVLFQTGLFRRIKQYETLSATTCRARLTPGNAPWFGSYMPSTLVWSDPGVRDAMMHAIQASIPSHLIVPISVRSIVRWPAEAAELVVVACEQERAGSTFTWDIDLQTAEGSLVEQWRGVVFGQVEPVPLERFVASPLLVAPYLQRHAADLFASRGILLNLEVEEASVHTDSLLQAAVQPLATANVEVLRRGDGKPEVYGYDAASPIWVSASNTQGLSLAVGMHLPVGCDVEVIRDRDENLWEAMLGRERFGFCKHLARSQPARLHEYATRLWCIREALTKSGFDEPGTIHLLAEHAEGWMEFRCGEALVLSWAARLRYSPIAMAIAVSNLPSRNLEPLLMAVN